MKEYSRRAFIKNNSKAGLGLFLAMSMPSLLLNSRVFASQVNEPIIDIHQHTNYVGRPDDVLIAHQRNMGVTTTILLPAGHPVSYGSTYYGMGNGLQAEATPNEACYKLATEFPKEFRFGSCEVPDVPGAVQEIEKYLKLGAPVIGELKFGVECDSSEMQKIYELAQQYNVPVHMHWQYNMYNRGFERFHTMLEKYPKVNFIGHSQTWWAYIDLDYKDPNVLYPKGKVKSGGLTDRLLRDYPNMYGDYGAGSGLGSITRDEEHMRGFMERHQDKLVFGSDCTDHLGNGPTCAGAKLIAAIRKVAPSKIVERKILYENAKKLFRL